MRDDRPHERSACLGSGMKLKAKQKNFPVISKLADGEEKEFEGNISF